MKHFEVDGIVITPEKVTELREVLIEIRDAALKLNRFDYVFPLSLNIAVLGDYIERIK